MSGDPITLSAQERDLLHGRIVARIKGGLPDQMSEAVLMERWDDARPLAVELSDLLLLVSQDLGWEEQKITSVELTIPTDVRRRAAVHLGDPASQILLRGATENALADGAASVAPGDVRLELSGMERDEMFEVISARLSGIGDIAMLAENENWDEAKALALECAALLRVVNDGLGWGRRLGKPVVFGTCPDVLRRALPAVSLRVDCEIAEFTEQVFEATVRARAAVSVKAACSRLLDVIEDRPPGQPAYT